MFALPAAKALRAKKTPPVTRVFFTEFMMGDQAKRWNPDTHSVQVDFRLLRKNKH
jgi:hypothetical protein